MLSIGQSLIAKRQHFRIYLSPDATRRSSSLRQVKTVRCEKTEKDVTFSCLLQVIKEKNTAFLKGKKQ